MMGVSYWTVWRMLADGELPRVNVGRRNVRTSLQAVQDYIVANTAA